MESVYRRRNKPKRTSASSNNNENAVFDTLCTVHVSAQRSNETPNISEHECNEFDHVINSGRSHCERSITLDHHAYDKLSNTCIRKSSKPQPFVDVTVKIMCEDYAALGFDLSTQTMTGHVPAMADTGCQSCLAGIKVIHRLGLRKSDLIAITMRMHTANNGGINILGATVLRLSGKDKQGQVIETWQMTYVKDSSDKLFLSREACAALDIIPDSFPKIGIDPTVQQSDATAVLQEDPTIACHCPQRRRPPPPPTKLPFLATDANRLHLQQYLLEYYKSSTFNTCEHQTLSLMDGPPMKPMVDPNAEPVTHHTPVPVALHWRDAVKAGLNHDVQLGVLEPVPIGEPVTWCHRMVVCPKKNGQPRRTVDFQALNAHATRETHHTPSPFHQARSVPNGKKKTVFDAWNGYHSMPVCREDRHLTTFITHWGRYRYKTAPQGYIASGDGYTRRYDEIVSDIPNKTKCIDQVRSGMGACARTARRCVHFPPVLQGPLSGHPPGRCQAHPHLLEMMVNLLQPRGMWSVHWPPPLMRLPR
uniref:Polyprotein n=1 Tax=Eptatretus burgeri TaxID=7764 RepID=A0A8C4Q621_EPTBU